MCVLLLVSALLLHQLVVLLANIDVFLNSEISALNIEGILRIYLNWVQEFELCLLSLVTIVHVQEFFPNVLVVWEVSQIVRRTVEHFGKLI